MVSETINVTTSQDDYDLVTATLVLRRQPEFHLSNTFVQLFVLVLIGFMSFFFDLENFNERIMVTLTTLLVIATLNSSIQAVSQYINHYQISNTSRIKHKLLL